MRNSTSRLYGNKEVGCQIKWAVALKCLIRSGYLLSLHCYYILSTPIGLDDQPPGCSPNPTTGCIQPQKLNCPKPTTYYPLYLI